MTTTQITRMIELKRPTGTRTVEETVLTGTISAIHIAPQSPLYGATEAEQDSLTLTGGHVIPLGRQGLTHLVTTPAYLAAPVAGVPERLVGQTVTVTLWDGAVRFVQPAE